jgi:sulfite reductase alpha subunit-like flavoprotein
MTLFYYSQTGTAEDFARRIADDARLYGFHSKVVDVEDYDTVRLSNIVLRFFVSFITFRPFELS